MGGVIITSNERRIINRIANEKDILKSILTRVNRDKFPKAADYDNYRLSFDDRGFLKSITNENGLEFPGFREWVDHEKTIPSFFTADPSVFF